MRRSGRLWTRLEEIEANLLLRLEAKLQQRPSPPPPTRMYGKADEEDEEEEEEESLFKANAVN